MAHAAPPNPALTIFWDNKRHGRVLSLQHHDWLWIYIQPPCTATAQNRQYRLLQPLDEPTAPILGQAYVRYPSVGLGTCPQSIITDQITDHYAPYCDELGYAVCNDIRVLAVIRCSSREPSPPRCAIDHQTRAVYW